jgi:hypothetical protein
MIGTMAWYKMQQYTVLGLPYQQKHYNLYVWNTVLSHPLHQSHPVLACELCSVQYSVSLDIYKYPLQ